MNPQRLSALFDQHAADLAPHLLGCCLLVTVPHGAVTVRLTEVEAYGGQGEDPGAHSYSGRTARNASLFGPPRHAYVYLSYGIHTCLNLVANAEGAGGVLLRAAEVLDGRALAVERRGRRDTGAKLLSGPGRLGQGLGVALSADGAPLEIGAAPRAGLGVGPMQLLLTPPPEGPLPPEHLRSGPRVGVSGIGGSEAFPWRFWIDGDPTVSAYRPGKNVPLRGGESQ